MELLLDAGPLIYMAKLEALDVFGATPWRPVATTGVIRETARAELGFLHPEVVSIQEALATRAIEECSLSADEEAIASQLGQRVGGLHQGELEVLAVGRARGWDVCLHERQASRLAGSLGLRTVHVVEVLFAGVSDPARLGRVVRSFADLTNMAASDATELLQLVERRHR